MQKVSIIQRALQSDDVTFRPFKPVIIKMRDTATYFMDDKDILEELVDKYMRRAIDMGFNYIEKWGFIRSRAWPSNNLKMSDFFSSYDIRKQLQGYTIFQSKVGSVDFLKK